VSRARSALLAALALFACGAAPVLAQRVLTEVRPQPAFLGQEIRFIVQVRDARSATCELAAVDGLRLELADQGVTNQSTQITIVNGRRQMVETVDYAFVYRVTAARAGRFVVPAPRVTVDGEVLAGARPTALQVDDPARDERALVEVSAEPPALVLGQQGRLIVDVLLEHLPPELNQRDPLGVYDRGGSFSFFDQGTPPPTLALPWISDPPQGLGKIDLQSWVRARQARSGLPFAGVQGGRFLESGQVSDLERDGRDGTRRRYRRYRFTLPIRGEVAGTYELPAASLEGALVSRDGGQLVWRNGFARSDPLRVEVLEPPREGRPASFSGAVGSFRFEMEPPSPTIVRVGDAVYLTLVVRGEGFLKGVGFDLGAQLGDGFRVERVGVTDSLPPGAERPAGFPDRPGPWRQWDFKVFPMDERVRAIPSLEFAWFDPDARQYATARTEPVPITVQPVASGAGEVLVGPGAVGAGRRSTELVATAALSANVTDLNLLGDQRPEPWPWLGLLAALPVAYALIALLVGRHRRLREDPALLRRRRALARASARLRAAAGRPGAAALRDAHGALRGFAADLSDGDEDALTSAELLAFLERRGIEAGLRARVERLGEEVEAAAYGGGDRAADRSLLEGLERVLQAAAKAGAALLLALGLGMSAAQAQDIAAFQAAQAAFERGEFEAAARGFEAQLGGGYENGYLLYDLGNAWLRAGELGRAIAAYRRATRYLPTDANLEVNLRRALDARRRPLSPPDDRALLDHLMFWRRSLPYRTELQVALGLGGLAFGIALIGLFRRRPGLRWPALGVAVLAVLFAVSAVLDHRALVARDSAVVVVDDTPLRIAPGETFEPAYEQALGEGAELEIRGRRDGWLLVRAGGEYEGWLPESAVATW
jgi:tetratricopeptide (TPR) repeat protein